MVEAGVKDASEIQAKPREKEITMKAMKMRVVAVTVGMVLGLAVVGVTDTSVLKDCGLVKNNAAKQTLVKDAAAKGGLVKENLGVGGL